MREVPSLQPDRTGPTDTHVKSGSKPALGRWFWGAIVVMALISIGLSLVPLVRDPVVSTEDLQPDAPAALKEMSSAELNALLNNANQTALAAVNKQIHAILDEIYEPVYAAIPTYATYHYSVWGEYAELTVAAWGNVGQKLDETLFVGLDSRLNQAGLEIDSRFNTVFRASLDVKPNVGTRGTGTLGRLTQAAIGDTLNRMIVTAPVGTTAAIGTAVAIKAVVKTMAQKIAKKLTLKAAAKASGKWAATGTGAGAGALLCSWAGPGAGLCAAAGGVGAWLMADYGIVKLDEYWNRADFEADLRFMVDEQKREHKASLERAIASRALAVQELSAEAVQRHDFTLRELAGGTNQQVCEAAERMMALYEPLRSSLGARAPEAIQQLLASANEHRGDLSLDRLAVEISENLRLATVAKITEVHISGNLPEDFREDRKVSIELVIDGKTFRVENAESLAFRGFDVLLHPGVEIEFTRSLIYRIAVEQHVRLWSNNYFGGSGSLKLTDSSKDKLGLFKTITAELPISLDENARDLDKVTVALGGGELLAVTIQLLAEPLPALSSTPNCE